MENIPALRKHSATIVYRYLRRVRDRNQATNLIQNRLSFRDSINDTTILGTPLSELPEIYKYFKPGSSSLHQDQAGRFSFGNCYTHDIRELIEMLRTNYERAKCPYTNKPWTRYEKFHMVRTYYTRRSKEDFQDLVMDKATYRELNTMRVTLNFLLDPYNNFNIGAVADTHLFNLITELMKYQVEDVERSALWVSQIHHHYINRNIDNYRLCCYMFLTHMIEGANDRQVLGLRIKARLEYCIEIYPVTDPLKERQVQFNDIQSLLNFFDLPDVLVAPVRRRSRTDTDTDLDLDLDSDSDSERPHQRRRTRSSDD